MREDITDDTPGIINTVRSLPLSDQQKVLEALESSLRPEKNTNSASEEIERMLLAEGLISEFPEGAPDSEEERYTPLDVSGKALSQIILENRE